MSQKERDKQDNKTMIIALFVIVPICFVGFFISAAIVDFIVKGLGNEAILELGKLTIWVIVALILFGIGYKVFKKIGIN